MKLAIVDERISAEARRTLSLSGFYIIDAPRAKGLPAPLASHPDMLIFKHESTLITSCDYVDEAPFVFEDIFRLIPSLTLVVSDESFGESYPHDAIFNALTVGERIFIKSDTASRAVLEYAKKRGLEIINSKQGYPACTTLAIDGRHTISSDLGMVKLLRENGIETLNISEGEISLPPYEYGFIGGAAGVFRDTVYFIGSLDTHPDGERIKEFCRAAGKRAISLATHTLTDLGRIIFIDDGV